MVYFPLRYVSWHYGRGLPNLFVVTVELLRFLFNFFSVGLFLRTLFRPMFSVRESVQDEELVADMFSLIVGNILLRVLGFFLRTVFIMLGLFFSLLTLCVMLLIIAIWALLPVLMLASIYAVITLLAH